MMDAVETSGSRRDTHLSTSECDGSAQDGAALPKKSDASDTGRQESLVDDLLQVQEVIQQHKTDLAGLPEALRLEAQHLREELSQMELFSRLGELKVQLCEAAGTPPDDSNMKQNRPDGKHFAEDEHDSSREARTALVCEAEDKELDIQLNQLCQAVEDAKQSKMDLETRKMQLQKEMLEMQLLLNAEDGTASDDNVDEECSGPDDDSPRIPAVNHFQIKELCHNDDGLNSA